MGKGSGGCDGRQAMMMHQVSFSLEELSHERRWQIIAGDHTVEIHQRETNGQRIYRIRSHTINKAISSGQKLPVMEYALGDGDEPDTALSLLYDQEFSTITELQQAIEQLTGEEAKRGFSYSIWTAEQGEHLVRIYRHAKGPQGEKGGWLWKVFYKKYPIGVSPQPFSTRNTALAAINNLLANSLNSRQ